MASIQKELASGIIYTAISKYSGINISLAVAGVLARLIDPEEFGVVAIATVIISFFSIFSDSFSGKNDTSHKKHGCFSICFLPVDPASHSLYRDNDAIQKHEPIHAASI